MDVITSRFAMQSPELRRLYIDMGLVPSEDHFLRELLEDMTEEQIVAAARQLEARNAELARHKNYSDDGELLPF